MRADGRSPIWRYSIGYRASTSSGEYAEAGLLLAFGSSRKATQQRAATYIDKILKGARPTDLPVEEPSTFELIINLKTAKAMGLTIPRSVLLRADEVLQ